MSEEEFYKFKILWKLVSHRKLGHNYTRFENVASGLPSDKIGACLEVAEQLLKERFLIPHKKGKFVSLNIKRKKEIMEFLDRFNE